MDRMLRMVCGTLAGLIVGALAGVVGGFVLLGIGDQVPGRPRGDLADDFGILAWATAVAVGAVAGASTGLAGARAAIAEDLLDDEEAAAIL